MKKKNTLILGIIVLILVAAAASIVLGRAAIPPLPADDPTAEPQAEEAATVVPEPTGETEPVPVPTAEEFAEGYFRQVTSFHPGTAGSSLRQAEAACACVHFAAHNRIAEVDIPLLRSTMLTAWESLSDEERGWFDENFVGMAGLIDACHTDWESNQPLFGDAGVSDQMAILMDDPAAWESWSTLCAHTLTLGNEEVR